MQDIIFKTPTVNLMHTPEYKAYMEAGKASSQACTDYVHAHTEWHYERSAYNEARKTIALLKSQRLRAVAREAGELLEERRTIRRPRNTHLS